MEKVDVLIVGAGAAGLMCAANAAQRGRKVLLIDHAQAAGEKIRISGGGRCNFTNMNCAPDAYISQNPKFAISALRRFSQWDFLDIVNRHRITWHEKTLGQLFCDDSAKEIVTMLLKELSLAGAAVRLQTRVEEVALTEKGFQVTIQSEEMLAASLVVATGGKSIPKMGATAFGYNIARQFGLKIEDTRTGLVPLVFGPDVLADLKPMAGLSLRASVDTNGNRFEEGLLFTHRGLSGPSILQVSSYWREGQKIEIDLTPEQDALEFLKERKQGRGAQLPGKVLAEILPKRLAGLIGAAAPKGQALAQLSEQALGNLSRAVNNWQILPAGTEGYRTAEVTVGGVSTDELDSQTMEARRVPGLYFIGEVVDVTGWLGGYNFQWAWSSGWAAGQVV